MKKNKSNLTVDYNMAVDTKDDYELSISCTRKDWRKFLADIAYTCNVNINWASESNPIVSSWMLNKFFHSSLITTSVD